MTQTKRSTALLPFWTPFLNSLMLSYRFSKMIVLTLLSLTAVMESTLPSRLKSRQVINAILFSHLINIHDFYTHEVSFLCDLLLNIYSLQTDELVVESWIIILDPKTSLFSSALLSSVLDVFSVQRDTKSRLLIQAYLNCYVTTGEIVGSCELPVNIEMVLKNK